MALTNNVQEELDSLEARAMLRIEQLDRDYIKLTNVASILQERITRIQQDEALLKIAYTKSKETRRDTLAREKKERSDDVIRNLQAALMGNYSDDSSSDSCESTGSQINSYDQQKMDEDHDIALGMIGGPASDADENVMSVS